MSIPKNQIRSRNVIEQHEHEDNASARRVVFVGPDGNFIGHDPTVPLNVRLSDGSVNIGTVNAELEVQLSHIANSPDAGDVADSVQVGDGEETLQITDAGEAYVNNGYQSLMPLISTIPWVSKSNYDEIQPQFNGDEVTLDYRENNAVIGQVILNFNRETGIWNFTSESFLVNPDGDRLLDDTGTGFELS